MFFTKCRMIVDIMKSFNNNNVIDHIKSNNRIISEKLYINNIQSELGAGIAQSV
jgi:hypothetical protein